MRFAIISVFIVAATLLPLVSCMDEVFYNLENIRNQIMRKRDELTRYVTTCQNNLNFYKEEHLDFEMHYETAVKFQAALDKLQVQIESREGNAPMELIKIELDKMEDLKKIKSGTSAIGGLIGGVGGLVGGARLGQLVVQKSLLTQGKIGPAALFQLTKAAKFTKFCCGAVGSAVCVFGVECVVGAIVGAFERDNLNEQLRKLTQEVDDVKNDAELLMTALSNLRKEIKALITFNDAAYHALLKVIG